jgi:cytochrome P450
LLTIIYNLFFSPLARFPGPKLWAISSIPCRLSILRGRHHLDVLDLYEKYGSVVRLGPNELAFNNPQAWRDIYAHRQLNGCLPKDRARYRPAPNGVDSLVTLIDNDVHASHRKMLAHCFSDRSLREQEDLVQVYVDKLNKCLRYLINSGQAEKMDIKAWMNCTTIDVLGDLMFGESFNCLEDRNVHPWVGLIFDSVKAVTFFTILSDFPIVDKLLPLLLPKKMKQIMLDHLELGMQKVDRRMSKGITRPDFMSAILQNGVQEQNGLYDKGKRVMTKEEIYANAVLLVDISPRLLLLYSFAGSRWHSNRYFRFIAAGSESSATLLSGVIFYLCKNPDKKNRLLEEIRTPFSYDSEITFTSTATLRYLKAVIEEGLRLYPPFVTVLSRECPMNGAIIDGHFVPEKVRQLYFPCS